MTWIEITLIIIGVCLDLFAAMECQGSLVAKVNKKQLFLICAMVGIWQLLALFLGHFLSTLLLKRKDIPDEFFAGQVLAIIILIGLGLRLFSKACKHERFLERLEKELKFKRFVRMAIVTSLYTVLAGIAFGFFGSSLWLILVLVFGISVLFIIAGMYTGYHLGFEHKSKAYIIGGAFLCVGAVDLVVRMIILYH